MNHIFAIVKIPIEIKPDKSYDILSDRIYTTVEKCDKLPPVNMDKNSDILQQLKGIINFDQDSDSEPEIEPKPEPKPEPEPEPEPEPQLESEPEIKLILNNTDLQHTKHNMTFRNMSQMKHNITKKCVKK